MNIINGFNRTCIYKRRENGGKGKSEDKKGVGT